MGSTVASIGIKTLLDKKKEREQRKEKQHKANREKKEIRRKAALKKAKLLNRNFSAGITGKMNDNILSSVDKNMHREFKKISSDQGYSDTTLRNLSRLI